MVSVSQVVRSRPWLPPFTHPGCVKLLAVIGPLFHWRQAEPQGGVLPEPKSLPAWGLSSNPGVSEDWAPAAHRLMCGAIP